MPTFVLSCRCLFPSANPVLPADFVHTTSHYTTCFPPCTGLSKQLQIVPHRHLVAPQAVGHPARDPLGVDPSRQSSHLRATLAPELYRTMRLRSSSACEAGLRLLRRPDLCAHVRKLALRPNYLSWSARGTSISENWVASMVCSIAPSLANLRTFDWDGGAESCPELKELYNRILPAFLARHECVAALRLAWTFRRLMNPEDDATFVLDALLPATARALADFAGVPDPARTPALCGMPMLVSLDLWVHVEPDLEAYRGLMGDLCAAAPGLEDFNSCARRRSARSRSPRSRTLRDLKSFTLVKWHHYTDESMRVFRVAGAAPRLAFVSMRWARHDHAGYFDTYMLDDGLFVLHGRHGPVHLHPAEPA
ncbi:hypothetical protein GGX14DRAFT_673800 [Mycena pura]|uniref:Uncharacterized protein n=1 Tax=Mycena pura TaxID=153505 RepID=A0AAD6Y8D4_9AGAR|nr:hypothetical protein GGX14DRAFT_673800 [Mycena pura]